MKKMKTNHTSVSGSSVQTVQLEAVINGCAVSFELTFIKVKSLYEVEQPM